MSDKSTKCLVADITCQSNTYHVASRDGVILDGITYKNAVTSWGDASLIGNFGTNYQVGSMAIKMTNGEFITDGGWEFDITDVWNNKTCEVKLCDVGTDTTFAGCKPYYKGIIKDFSCDSGELSFSLDAYDNADDTMLPAIVCEDQTALTAAESEFDITDSTQSAGEYIIVLTACTIFCAGELVLLMNNDGDYEYNRIANIAGNNYTMVNPLANSYDPISGVASKCKKPFVNIPPYSVGKSIPMQYGDMLCTMIDTLTSNNIFAKTVTINNKIGTQSLLADYIRLKNFNSIGIWNDDTKKYVPGVNPYELDPIDAEYEIGVNKNSAYFRLDSSTTLSDDIIEFTGTGAIPVTDYTKIQWFDEDNAPIANGIPYTYKNNAGELLSINIIAIGSELMLLVEKPASGNIYVERGYNGTTITAHSNGDKIYQNALFSGRNLLKLTERFDPIAITNMWWSLPISNFTESPTTCLPSNIIKKVTADITKYFEIKNTYIGSSEFYVNLDFIFPKITNGRPIFNWIAGISLENYFTTDSEMFSLLLSTFNPNAIETVNYDVKGGAYPQYDDAYCANLLQHHRDEDNDPNDNMVFDSWTYNNRAAGTFSANGNYKDRNLVNQEDEYNNFNLSDLTQLNKKWKLCIQFGLSDIPGQTTHKIHTHIVAFGFWIDYYVDFTKETICAALQGRIVTSAIRTVAGGAIGDIMWNPVQVICAILIQELNKLTTDFVTSGSGCWYDQSLFFNDDDNWDTGAGTPQNNFTRPLIAFSYGVSDERKKGYEFCEWIASHFNLAIPRNTAGKIDIVNLWKNQNDPGTPLEINIEDILQVPGGQRRISIKQTGVDLLYNDVVINYKRNNSTNEYQAVYIVPDNLQLINPIGGSPNTVAQARDTFYGGQKRTLTIESPFIYNEYDAIRKAQWEINDKAEAKFWVEFYIDYELYDNKSLSAQYKIGDVISLVGKCNGIKFANTEKFIIQDIINCDAGRELCIHAKSNDPVTAFFL